jgi:hypothetical protein
MDMERIRAYEAEILRRMAEAEGQEALALVKSDIGRACVVERAGDGTIVRFRVEGEPSRKGFRPLHATGKLKDIDGSVMDAIVHVDEEGHIKELEFVKWEGDVVFSPQIDTLRVY